MITRPGVIVRAVRKVGLALTARLVRIRFGLAQKIYSISIPQWPYPVCVRGGKSTDTIVLYELLVTGEYQTVDKLNPPPQTIIDGGANIGLTSVHLLNQYPGSRVISLEPFADTFEVCRRNLAPYGTRATAIQGAIWSSDGKVSLDAQGEDWANKVGAPVEGDSGTVRAYSMPTLIAQAGGFVDLLKIDVEGSEREIFDAGAKGWLSFIRNIVIEVHGKDCEDRLFEALGPYECELSNRDRVYTCLNLRPRVA